MYIAVAGPETVKLTDVSELTMLETVTATVPLALDEPAELLRLNEAVSVCAPKPKVRLNVVEADPWKLVSASVPTVAPLSVNVRVPLAAPAVLE